MPIIGTATLWSWIRQVARLCDHAPVRIMRMYVSVSSFRSGMNSEPSRSATRFYI